MDQVYVNDVIQTVRSTRPGLPGVEVVKKSSCIAATILLGLLCFFLLSGLITLGYLFSQGKSQWEMERVMLQKLYDNVTSERNQLQASYNSTVQERDQLQISLEGMTENRDNLQAMIQYCQNCAVFSGSWYYVSSNQKSWEESRQDCLQKGADLMIVNSQEELNFANHFKKYLWFGMTDVETEGTWKWVDGTLVTTSYWTSGEPNGGRNENCGQIMNYSLQNSWNDENCLVLHFWICEKRVSP